MIPRATYRFQFHKDFTFAQAEALVPYLDQLGVSHVYASPITTARSGSIHGYDVVDPTRINPELGGEDAFKRLVTALRGRGMGIIIDIVPNHMGVAGSENAWWQDVLARGERSAYARFFDIDWRRKLVLPVLGDPLGTVLDQGQLALKNDGRYFLSAYDEHRFPIRDEDQARFESRDVADVLAEFEGRREKLEALLSDQHYRLASWRTANDELNWRRFFTISDLAGLRIEDPDVFEATHQLYFRLYEEGLIDGVRVDHVDGLTDPAGYCRTLRTRLDTIARPEDAPPGPAYIVIEKILASGEPLAQDWGVDGTSGYDFMEEAAALLHAPSGEGPLNALWAETSGRSATFEPEELIARQDMLAWQFEGQLQGCVDAFDALAQSTDSAEGVTGGMLRRAVERLLWVFPVYRTYGNGAASPNADKRTREIARARVQRFIPPGETHVVGMILAWLAGEGPGDLLRAAEAVRRFQQLSSPIAAKAVEDTAFYRYGRLLSRNDVGFDPSRFSLSIGDFHAAMANRVQTFPNALLATATHDHKRGEDVRARLAVLSEIPALWREEVASWRDLTAPVTEGFDPADLYMLFQTIFGAWPEGLDINDREGLSGFAERLIGWQQKSLREAKLRSSWEAPDEAYETLGADLIRALLSPNRSYAFLLKLEAFLKLVAAPARANILVQTALRYTAPGVPDLYQGTELADFSLVDPDNRRPVDFVERQGILASQSAVGASAAKLQLISKLLAIRREHPLLFARGEYVPVEVSGERSEKVVAFIRKSDGEPPLLCVFAIHCAEVLLGQSEPIVPAAYWGDTRLVDPALDVATLLNDGPVKVQRVS
ncbi:malto-oligosyltrehalose synthase [Sphingobium sp. SCG-1]|uniref:malto-oligosyltrehalose synthase n=1 Tax=Sphingobium sp. SCG-1 TaxID=2072936 RepID=UPI000CD6C017|nr:malto-oligosyltrehalose synthase [Sphingobium sp. SCG-1]AUW58423.1 malto-oligosyltrehalose synthase [Sphingobium sp. SCG-1]